MEKWIVEGLMPEKAINRLQKSGISLFLVKKIEKKRILFCINKKDLEKAFAIYPNMCYNSSRGSVYSFTRVGALDAHARNVAKLKWFAVCLGICCFFLLVGSFSPFVFQIETVGANVYKREVFEFLREYGVREFSVYPNGVEDEIAAKILALDGVEFCSVQKRGNTVTVEVRTNAFSSARQAKGDFLAPCDGRVEKIVTLSGTPLKKIGDEVKAGEKLVGGYLLVGEEQSNAIERVVVAKALLVCEKSFESDENQDWVAEARLFVEGLGGEVIEIVAENEKICVRYSLLVKMNM